MNENINLQEAYDLFIVSRQAYCSDSTIGNYEHTLGYLFDYLSGFFHKPVSEIAVNDITLLHLNNYVIYLRSKKKNDKHPYAPTSARTITKRTVRTYSVDMRTFFNFLYAEGYIERNPMARFKIIKAEKKAIIPLNSDEISVIDNLFNASTVSGCRNLLIIHFLLDEGMRSSEVCNLQLSDIHLTDSFIIIRNGKGSKDRVLPLGELVKSYIEIYLNDFREATHDYFLCSINEDAPITKDAIKSLFARIKKHTGINRIYPHLFRHTFATSFLCGGGSLEMLRIYMGHADIKTTECYLHVMNAIQFCPNIYRLDSIFFKRLY